MTCFNPTFVTNKFDSKFLLMTSDSDDDKGLHESFKNIILNGEGKRSPTTCKDPIGQLLAGMDKTMADLIGSRLNHGTIDILWVIFHTGD